MKMAPAAQSNALNGDWDRALYAARAAGIDAAKVELRQPKGEGKAWTVTEVDRSWPTQVDAVAIAPQSFAVVDQLRFDTFPLIAKLTRWGIDAHMGILFGLPNQLLLAAFGLGLCLMIALGYRMWWIRRPAAGAQHPVHTLVAAWLALSLPARAGTLLVAAALGYCLPVMGMSLAALLLADVWRWRGQRQSHRDETPEAAARRAEVRKFRAAVATVAVADRHLERPDGDHAEPDGAAVYAGVHPAAFHSAVVFLPGGERGAVRRRPACLRACRIFGNVAQARIILVRQDNQRELDH